MAVVIEISGEPLSVAPVPLALRTLLLQLTREAVNSAELSTDGTGTRSKWIPKLCVYTCAEE